MVKCPKCGRTDILSTYEIETTKTINVNTGEVMEITEGAYELSNQCLKYYCSDCLYEWGRA